LVIWLCFVFILLNLFCAFEHTYGHWIAPLHEPGHPRSLPPITEYISIPILNSEAPFYHIYFGLLFLVSIVLLVGVWYIREQLALLEWFCFGFGIYFSFFIASLIIISFGPWAPFSAL